MIAANPSGKNGPRKKSTRGRNRYSVRNLASKQRSTQMPSTGVGSVRTGLSSLPRAKPPEISVGTAGQAPKPPSSTSSNPLQLGGGSDLRQGMQALQTANQSAGSSGMAAVAAMGQGGGKQQAAGGPWMDTVPNRFEKWVIQAAKRYNLPPALVAAVGQVESGWGPGQTSSAGAVGLMQTMPFWQGEQPYNIYKNRGNIFAGAHILRRYLDTVAGGRRTGLAAYNAGPGNLGAGMDYAAMVLNLFKQLKR